jgi:hypothetical protein
MELGEWYNPPFVRVLAVKYCHMRIAHSVSIDVLDEEGRRRRTATMQNLPGVQITWREELVRYAVTNAVLHGAAARAAANALSVG